MSAPTTAGEPGRAADARAPSRMRFPPWAADAITLSRIVLMPPFLLAAEATNTAARAGADQGAERALALTLLALIAASDKLDGWLARRSGGAPGRRGAILDATADRVVQWSGIWFFTLRAEPAFTALPYWLALALVGRDALLLAIWLVRRRAHAVSFEHELHGKAATVGIFLALIAATFSARAGLAHGAALLAAGAVAFSTVRYAARTLARR